MITPSWNKDATPSDYQDNQQHTAQPKPKNKLAAMPN